MPTVLQVSLKVLVWPIRTALNGQQKVFRLRKNGGVWSVDVDHFRSSNGVRFGFYLNSSFSFSVTFGSSFLTIVGWTPELDVWRTLVFVGCTMLSGFFYGVKQAWVPHLWGLQTASIVMRTGRGIISSWMVGVSGFRVLVVMVNSGVVCTGFVSIFRTVVGVPIKGVVSKTALGSRLGPIVIVYFIDGILSSDRWIPLRTLFWFIFGI